jgi:hypothetical protein
MNERLIDILCELPDEELYESIDIKFPSADIIIRSKRIISLKHISGIVLQYNKELGRGCNGSVHKYICKNILIITNFIRWHKNLLIIKTFIWSLI